MLHYRKIYIYALLCKKIQPIKIEISKSDITQHSLKKGRVVRAYAPSIYM